jgi:hypothetical protein
MTVMRNLLMPDHRTDNTAARAAAVPDVHLLDCSASGGSDAGRRDAVIDDRVVVSADDVVHHRGVVIDHASLMMRHAIAVIAMAAEIVIGHKREAIPRQPERKARTA